MKRFFKVFANVMAIAITVVAGLSLSACEDIKKVELDLNIYDYENAAVYSAEESTLTLDLYRHLAPKTVDKIIEYVNAGYYNNAIFYKDSAYSNQIMVGDLKMDENGNITQNLIDGKLPSQIYGEFEYNGTYGSDLVSSKGYVGLWRSWYEFNDNTYKTSNGMDSARATMYFPTSSISNYKGYFCVFAKYDTKETVNSATYTALTAAFGSDNTVKYVIFFTGEYDESKADKNYGLIFNAVLESEFEYDDEDKTLYNGKKIFVAEDKQFVEYNFKTITVAKPVSGVCGAKINSAKI